MNAKYPTIAALAALILIFARPLGASPFVKIPVSAKSVSLAGGFVAGDDLGVMEKNPAGLSSLRGLNAEFSYVRYFEDVAINSFNGAYASKTFALGFGYKSYTVEDVARNSFGEASGAITHSESLVSFAVSSKIGRDMAAGLGFKSLGSKIADGSAGGISTALSGTLYDVGLVYNRRDDSYALSATNIGSGLKYDYTGAIERTAPLVYALGARHSVGSFVGLWQISKAEDTKRLTLATGVDYDVTENFALRLGMKYTKYFDLAFGAGFKYGKFYINYALAPHMDFGAAHTVTVGAKF